MPWLKLREIVILNDCEKEIDLAREQYARFDEAWDGVKWLLARNPEPPGSFPSVTTADADYFIYGFRGDAASGIPDMWIFYEYSDDEITIHGINANDAPSEENEDDEGETNE
jgi:hypothetical protein